MHECMDAQARTHMLLQVVQQFTLPLSLLQYTKPSISTESWLMICQVGACLTYIQQWVANVALPIFNRKNVVETVVAETEIWFEIIAGKSMHLNQLIVRELDIATLELLQESNVEDRRSYVRHSNRDGKARVFCSTGYEPGLAQWEPCAQISPTTAETPSEG
jgi:hypothetical protein